jgi:fructose-1,6-bisphosphatase
MKTLLILFIVCSVHCFAQLDDISLIMVSCPIKYDTLITNRLRAMEIAKDKRLKVEHFGTGSSFTFTDKFIKWKILRGSVNDVSWIDLKAPNPDSLVKLRKRIIEYFKTNWQANEYLQKDKGYGIIDTKMYFRFPKNRDGCFEATLSISEIQKNEFSIILSMVGY